MNHEYDFSDCYVPDEAAAARPGERVNIGNEVRPLMATATNRYMYAHDCLFRSFAWCDFEICNAPAFSPRGEWMAVRGHWKQFVKNGRRANAGQP